MPAKTWIGWGLTLAGVLAAAPLVLGRGDPALSHARETISNMSEIDRVALKRKYQQYLSLSEQQRADMRKLHDQLESDRITGPRFRETMALYCNWLRTIDAWQQDELAHLEQPMEKAQRVASIIEERSAEADEAENDQGPGTGRLQRVRLNEAQLTNVFDFLTRQVKLTEEEQQQVGKLKGLQRFGAQVRFLREKANQNPEKIFRSLSETDLIELTDQSGNAELKAILSKPGAADVRRKRLARGIFPSLLDQLVLEASNVTESQLRAHLTTLPPEQQDQLLQLHSDQFQRELKRSFLMSDPYRQELKTLVDRDLNLSKRRLTGGAAAFGPRGDGKSPRRDGGGGPLRPMQGFLDRNRPPSPGDQEPSPDDPNFPPPPRP